MRRKARAVLPALALLACAAPQDGQSAAAAFAPLMGCWRGVFEGRTDIYDERCFEPLGEHAVDTHAVRPTSYAGETTYHYDPAAGEIVWAYAGNDGGRANGAVRVDGDRFVFPPHTHRSAAGVERRLRATWRVEGADRFVATSEQLESGRWRPFMRIVYTRTAAAPRT